MRPLSRSDLAPKKLTVPLSCRQREVSYLCSYHIIGLCEIKAGTSEMGDGISAGGHWPVIH